MSGFLRSDGVYSGRVIKILLYVYARQDAFDVQTDSVFRVDAKVSSEANIIVVCVSGSEHMLLNIVSVLLDIALESCVDDVIFVFCIVVESV